MKWWIAVLMLIALIGCGSPDNRYAELADRALREQSKQNSQAAQQTQQIAEASRQLVEADARTREALIEAHQHLQSGVDEQRLIVDQQRDALEVERRQLAEQRQRAPEVAGAIGGMGGLMAMVLPLVVAIYVLRYMFGSSEPAAAELVELLSQEVLSGTTTPALTDELPSPRITQQS